MIKLYPAKNFNLKKKKIYEARLTDLEDKIALKLMESPLEILKSNLCRAFVHIHIRKH